MLQALSQLDHAEGQAVLAGLALNLLPDPGIAEEKDWVPGDEEVRRRVLDELHSRCNVRPGDDSTNAQSKIVSALGSEIVDREISRMDLSKVRNRLKAVLLPERLGSLELTFAEEVWKRFERLGVRRTHVGDAIRNPDHVLFFRAREEPHGPERGFVATRRIRPRGADDFTLLMLGSQTSHAVNVVAAVRVYGLPEWLDHSQPALGILEKFLAQFGIEFSVTDRPKTTLIHHDAISGVRNNRELDRAMKYVGTENCVVLALGSHNSRLAVFDADLVMAIDLEKYASFLRQRGVGGG